MYVEIELETEGADINDALSCHNAHAYINTVEGEEVN